MAYLTCTRLAVGHAGVPVVKDVSFSVSAGDALFVVGENGAGKSTLLKTLLGLLPPLAGAVSFSDGVLAGEIGYLPQKSESQRDFPASAWEVALSGRASRLGLRPFYSDTDKEAAENAMRQVGAIDLRDMPFGSLSGGQQQRVLLARALASGPKLLVLDEPTTGLDPNAAEALYVTIDDLRSSGVGVLAVTHDVEAALPHATQVLRVEDGVAAILPASAWRREGGAA
ncbi:MAG: metal ABC transporter ATP-binding protein [Eggerthellaceae bacterium]|nr:metal ABC transporter ATP-binding protein [Eggerthellaceae bacterium]